MKPITEFLIDEQTFDELHPVWEGCREAVAGEGTFDFSNTNAVAARIRKKINSFDSDTLAVLVAHNDNGVLKFHDGSKLVQKTLTDLEPQVWTISCNLFLKAENHKGGIGIGVDGRITYESAIRAFQSIRRGGTFRDRLF